MKMKEEIKELKMELQEANESINWWTNRFKAVEKENQKLNKIINELEKWLKETKKFNYGFKIKSEYIYAHEFVCKNILKKLTELKKEVE